LFNRGGTLAELKERCQAETGLPAPVTPVWN
jgi:N-methylhydantoinase B